MTRLFHTRLHALPASLSLRQFPTIPKHAAPRRAGDGSYALARNGLATSSVPSTGCTTITAVPRSTCARRISLLACAMEAEATVCRPRPRKHSVSRGIVRQQGRERAGEGSADGVESGSAHHKPQRPSCVSYFQGVLRVCQASVESRKCCEASRRRALMLLLYFVGLASEVLHSLI